MTVPSSVTQLLVTLVLVIPGFVYQIVRIRLRGRSASDSELATRIVYALVASTILALFYLTIFGQTLTDAVQADGDLVAHPRLAAALALVGVVTVPVLAAALPSLPRLHLRQPLASLKAMMRPDNWTRVSPSPTAWDAAFSAAEPGFIRVRMRDGSWFAGYFGESSYASSFPDPRSLFFEYSYSINGDGEIGTVNEAHARSELSS